MALRIRSNEPGPFSCPNPRCGRTYTQKFASDYAYHCIHCLIPLSGPVPQFEFENIPDRSDDDTDPALPEINFNLFDDLD